MLELIVAYDKNRLIGKGSDLPWHIKEDLQHFKKITTGNRIIMGRGTFESIGRILPNRESIVLSRKGFEKEGVKVYESAQEMLKNLDDTKRNFVIGGSKIYKELLPFVDVLHISHVKGTYEGDVYFPEIDFNNWEIVGEEIYEEFQYVVYKKK